MPISIETIQRPKPTDVTIETPDGAVRVTYDRNALGTDEIISQVHGMGVRTRLSKILLAWDVVDSNGQPYQPHDRDDVAHWQGEVKAQRRVVYDAWVKLKSQRDALTPDAAAKLSPLPDAPTAPDASITMQDRRDAYSAAWSALLLPFPKDFLGAIDEGIIDDFLAAKERTNATATGSPPKAKPGTSPGSSGTPTP